MMPPGMGLVSRLADAQIGRPMRESKLVLAVVIAAVLLVAPAVTCRRWWRTSLTLAAVGLLVVAGGPWAPVRALGERIRMERAAPAKGSDAVENGTADAG